MGAVGVRARGDASGGPRRARGLFARARGPYSPTGLTGSSNLVLETWRAARRRCPGGSAIVVTLQETTRTWSGRALLLVGGWILLDVLGAYSPTRAFRSAVQRGLPAGAAADCRPEVRGGTMLMGRGVPLPCPSWSYSSRAVSECSRAAETAGSAVLAGFVVVWFVIATHPGKLRLAVRSSSVTRSRS